MPQSIEPQAEVKTAAAVSAEWGLVFDPAVVISGSFGVTTSSREVTQHGLTYWETRQDLSYETCDHDLRIAHRYARRWMGDHWDAPVGLGVSVRTCP